MSTLDSILARAKSKHAHIVLPEGRDERIVQGALRATEDKIAKITLLGQPDRISQIAGNHPSRAEIQIIDPATSPLLESCINGYMERRKTKGATLAEARSAMLDPLGFAAMMVHLGHADGTVGGAVATTSDTVRAALRIIGKAPESAIVSSFFAMVLNTEPQKTIVFADCALVVQPDANELASIAISSARSFEDLVGEIPKVAMLSFSTHGSAKDPSIDTIVEATEIVRKRQPGLIIDGEMQFDAAFEPNIGRVKAPGSPLAGQANVFVFPNLHAGNIGYKIAQRIGGAAAIGPILQGLAKPANDLSRGCSIDDVYHMIAVTAAQSVSAT